MSNRKTKFMVQLIFMPISKTEFIVDAERENGDGILDLFYLQIQR
jgi:hypothetical protein